MSEIAVPVEGAADLEHAFRHRLGAVDAWPGFVGLTVLRDRRRHDRFVMVTQWTSKEAFLAYMRSDDHRRSHGRMPDGPNRPRPAGFDEFDVVST